MHRRIHKDRKAEAEGASSESLFVGGGHFPMQKMDSRRKCGNFSQSFLSELADGQWHGQSTLRLQDACKGLYLTENHRNQLKRRAEYQGQRPSDHSATGLVPQYRHDLRAPRAC
jgi:hypothetical protein